MAGGRKTIWLAALLLLPGSIGLGVWQWYPSANDPRDPLPQPIELPKSAGMILLPGGSFSMGSPRSADSLAQLNDAQPMHLVRLEPFWLDARAVTNRQFEQFVAKTDYQTEAELRGTSLVFDRQLATWREVVGANWRHPDGPESSLVGKEHFPVVQVSWRDAVTYAAWANKRLPTEAEFEYAARGGLADCQYPWGRALRLDERHLANGWQGHFPDEDQGSDGYRGPSPVGKFPPNRFGLYDMAGNVWNWCFDRYAADYYAASLADDPRGPTDGEQRVRRGGSWLSAENYGGSLRLDYRDHAPPSESTNHTGFRCARSVDAP